MLGRIKQMIAKEFIQVLRTRRRDSPSPVAIC